MPIFIALSHVVLVITAGVFFYTAITDLKEFTVRNELILVLVGLFFLHALLSGRWIALHWNIGFALLMFSLMLVAYAQNWMGGGDLKLLTVVFLWVGPSCALPFAILLALFASLHTAAAKFGWAAKQQDDSRARIPFAPSIAAAAVAIFLMGCLQPLT
jgi:prepilin peptidase CpaA